MRPEFDALPTAASWQPPSDLSNHGGDPLSSNDDFFAAPPPQIGQLLSAATTLKKDMRPLSIPARLAATAAAAAVCWLVGWVIVREAKVQSPAWTLVWEGGLPPLGALIAWFATSFTHTCTFVGQYGVAVCRCSGSRHSHVEREVFLFHQATELRTSLIVHYTNNIYAGSEYNFEWTNAEGHVCHTICGTFWAESSLAPPNDQYHFGVMAEMSWSQFLLDKVLKDLEQNVHVRFNLGGSDWVRIGPGWIEFHLAGQTHRCLQEDLATATIGNGELEIRRRDAHQGWLSSSGVFKFQYRDVANAKLFLLLFDHLAGPRN
jgi:hypothetical protein